MSDSGERERRGIRSLAGRVASRTTGKHWAAAGAGLVLAVTAPFGGLDKAEPPGAGTVQPGKVFEVGPFDLTVDRVVTVSDLEPSAEPETEGNRLIVLVGSVRNPGTRPEFGTQLTGALRLRGAGVVDGVRTQLFSYTDSQAISTVNPGLTYDVAIVFEQQAGWEQQPVRLDVERLDYLEEDPLTLDANYWLATGETARRGTFDVEVKE